MRWPVDAPLAWGLSAALHIAVYGWWTVGAPQSAGDGGAASATVPGLSGVVEATIVVWDMPPAVRDDPPAPMTQISAIAAPPTPVTPPGVASAPDHPASSAALADAMDAPAKDAPPGEAPPPPPALPAPNVAEPPHLAAPSPDLESPIPPPPPQDHAALSREMAGPAIARPPAAERSQQPLADSPPAPPVPPPPEPPATDPAKPPPVPPVRPQSRPELVAQGSGGAGVRGNEGRAETPALSDGLRQSIVAAWGAEIRARIEARKVHPPGLRASGRPVVRITVGRSGTLEDVRVVRSSEIAALDEAAVKAVRRAGRFPSAPDELDLARVSFDLPISFTR
jgi:protein TonB